MGNNVKLLSKFLLPTLKESQLNSEKFQSKSAELLERAGYIRKVLQEKLFSFDNAMLLLIYSLPRVFITIYLWASSSSRI